MKNNLRVSNMVITGKMPFKKKLNEAERKRLVLKGGYFLINEDTSPIFMKKMQIRKKVIISVHNKQKIPVAFIWTSGAINIVGVLNKKEGDIIYGLVMKDIKKYCKRVLK